MRKSYLYELRGNPIFIFGIELNLINFKISKFILYLILNHWQIFNSTNFTLSIFSHGCDQRKYVMSHIIINNISYTWAIFTCHNAGV